MLRNYLLMAWRHLGRYRAFATINIVGLAIGLACCLLMLLYVQDEWQYDRFHTNAPSIYRVVSSTSEDGKPTNANGAFSVGPALKEDFPEILHTVRLHKMGWGEKRVFTRGDRRFYEERFFFADAEFFQVFTFPFRAGDPKTALVEPYTLVLTERMAEKYFGAASALGQTIRLDPYNNGQFTEYRVTGVLENLPHTSHLQFDFLASFTSAQGRIEGWGFDPVFTYVLLHPEADVAAVEARLGAFQQRYMGPDPWYSLHLQPLLDIRLHSHLNAELEPNGDVVYVYLFSALAVVILLLACINFMNLATARAARRAREVGMRKVLGAHRRQLVQQFLSEAMLVSLLAVLGALLLAEALLPVFNALSGKAMALQYRAQPGLLATLLGLGLLVGLLAGSYPAFFLSAFRPMTVLKGLTAGGSKYTTTLRKGLVVFQFATTVVLLICMATVAQQMDHIRHQHLGFDRDRVLVLPLNNELRTHYPAVREAWLRFPGIQAASLSEQVPARAGNGSSYHIEGVTTDDAPEIGFYRLFIDPDFVETYGIEVVAGRDLSTEYPSDTTTAFLVNETMVRQAGWASPEAALGKAVVMEHGGQLRSGQIVGVVRDFHLFSFRDGIDGVVMNTMSQSKFNFVSIRFSAGEAARVLAHLEQTWKTFAPDYPFDYYFLDDDFARLHAADARLGEVFRYFSALAMVVGCLGLFGLAAFMAEARRKEIGIRKTLGASVVQVLGLLCGEFARLVLLALVMAAPVGYFVMYRWLEDFRYHIDLGAGPFLVAGVTALGVALVTVGYESLKAALTDPVTTLRHE
jgi:putative ABC transport system permease protein